MWSKAAVQNMAKDLKHHYESSIYHHHNLNHNVLSIFARSFVPLIRPDIFHAVGIKTLQYAWL